MNRPNILVRTFDAISQLANVVLLNGDANESISGRSFRQSWKSEKVINFIIFWEKDHCKLAYYADLSRAKALVYGEENASHNYN